MEDIANILQRLELVVQLTRSTGVPVTPDDEKLPILAPEDEAAIYAEVRRLHSQASEIYGRVIEIRKDVERALVASGGLSEEMLMGPLVGHLIGEAIDLSVDDQSKPPDLYTATKLLLGAVWRLAHADAKLVKRVLDPGKDDDRDQTLHI